MFAHLRVGTRSAAWLLSLIASGLALSPAIAQTGNKDLLEQVRRQNEVAAQKFDAEIRDSLATAQKESPARSAEILRTTLDRLEGDAGSVLAADRRDTLIRVVKDRLRASKTDVARKESAPKGDPRPDTRPIDQDQIKRGMAHIAQLQKDGKTSEAARAAQDLASQYPNDPIVQAAARSISTNSTLTAQNGATKVDTENRVLGAFEQVAKSAQVPKGDLEYNVPVWMKALARKSVNEQPMTAKEKQILEALNSTISVKYKGDRFDDVIEELATKLKLPILLDKASLNEAQVTSESQVSIETKGASGRSVLKRILAGFDLTYIIRDETIQVVTIAKAKESLVTRTFYVGHLVTGGQFEDAGIRFVPGLDAIAQAQNAQMLIDSIMAIDPDSWSPRGGAGSAKYNPVTKSITVRQTAEFQSILGGTLR
jgi:hypothetical protein